MTYPIAVKPSSVVKPPLNSDQQAAVSGILEWLAKADLEHYPANADSMACLVGPAGTGKTFSLQEVINQRAAYEKTLEVAQAAPVALLSMDSPLFANDGRLSLHFCAPTNKAAKVLREVLKKGSGEPVRAVTIYGLLGLKLEANGNVKEIKTPEKLPKMSPTDVIICDEASMLNTTLMNYCTRIATESGARFLFVGDPYQLPPVHETSSPVWNIPLQFTLKKVMRHDNSILTLATHVREQIGNPFANLRIVHSPDSVGDGTGELDYPDQNLSGVLKLGQASYLAAMEAAAARGLFSTPNQSKVVAWRNVTVQTYNRRIKQAIARAGGFPDAEDLSLPFCAGDRIIAAGPCNNQSSNKKEQFPLMHTDDEATVIYAEEGFSPWHPEYKVMILTARLDDTNQEVELHALHPDSQTRWEAELKTIAEAAKTNRYKWKDYWDLKEAFHDIRLAYAITAHRAQGSTYEQVFVDQADILINRNRAEALRCFYVAVSRPKTALWLP